MMNANEPTAHSAPEDLSDRSNSSSSETQLHAFQEYGKIKELNLSINRGKQPPANKTRDFSFALDGSRQHGLSFGSLAVDRSAKDLPVVLDKPKDFDFQSEKIKDISSYSLDRSEDTDTSLDTTKEYNPNLSRPKDNKDAIFSFDGIKDVHFPRESREIRTKNINCPVDRNKDSNFQKAYNYPLDRIKDFNFALDRRRDSNVGGLTLERLRGGSFLEPADYRNPQIQPRDDIHAMRRSQILTSDIGPRNLPAHLPYPHSITEMQHTQQQQQEQGKSFTIASILGLRNNQRDNPQRSHPYRKHQGQEGSAKNSSSGSSSGGSGKLKRVRTIFTAEQLERLEGEFARQQYMVGPERLYLAHTLRLTEAQVKVWFQNRRIKWRKVHQEQQSQRLHELHSLSSLEQDVEDSNDNSDCRDVYKPEFIEDLETNRKHYSTESVKIAYRGSKSVFLKFPKTLDTISEHTEPSPVPSRTMDQTDLESQSQMRKLRRGRHATSYCPSWTSRPPADGTTASDSYWKHGPRPTHSVPHSQEQRRQDYEVTEPVTSCYSASNTYRPKHRGQSSVLPKVPTHVPTSDQTYRTAQHGTRTARNKLLTTNNVAVVRKTCGYKEDAEEDDEVNKYDEEEVNYADENAEDEVAEEGDEDQDENYEYGEKDYEEQEADDEVDDESDAFQTQLHRMQQRVQKVSNHRAQHLRHIEQPQDLRKIQHQQQHAHKIYQDQKPPRFYPQAIEPHQPYGDAAELISDDQRTPPWTPDPRKSSRRMSETHQAVPPWVPARKSGERNRDRVSSPLATAQEHQRHQRHRHHHPPEEQHQQRQQQQQQLRRHRTTKPEIESLMMPPQSSQPIAKKCCICGGSTAPVTVRVGSPGKGNCRLHEYRGFTVKGPPGEDGEAEEQVVCGRCSKRHNMEDLRLGCEASSPEVAAPLSYSAKPHRSRIHPRSSMYESPEDSQTVEEMLAAYTSSQPRASNLDYAMPPRDQRTRHSVQSARSPSRRASYYER